MANMKKIPTAILPHFNKDEDGGVSTLEFIVLFPMFFAVFFWVFETGYYSFQSVMLDRGVHNTVRELMLTDVVGGFVDGNGDPDEDAAHSYLVQKVCEDSFLNECEDNLKLSLKTVDGATEQVPSTFDCVDRVARVDPAYQPTYNLNGGDCSQGNSDGSDPDALVLPILVIFQACLLSDPILPSGMSLPWELDTNGAIQLHSETAFLNEPC